MSRIVPTLTTALLIATASLAHPAEKWVPYRSDSLGFQLKMPSTWVIKEKGMAVGFRNAGDAEWQAAFGVLKSSEPGVQMEDAAAQQMKRDGASDWIQSPAQIGGRRAIKIVGTAPKQPSLRMVEYYVESGDGYFLIQTLANKSDWNQFSPAFATMLRTFETLR